MKKGPTGAVNSSRARHSKGSDPSKMTQSEYRSKYRFPSLGRSNNTAQALFHWCNRTGLSYLNWLHARSAFSEVPAPEVIEGYLRQIIGDRLGRLLHDFTNERHVRLQIPRKVADRAIRDAAIQIHEFWDPGYMDARRASGTAGGRKSAKRNTTRDYRRVTSTEEVADLTRQGYSAARIAHMLGISTRTVFNYRRAAEQAASLLYASGDAVKARLFDANLAEFLNSAPDAYPDVVNSAPDAQADSANADGETRTYIVNGLGLVDVPARVADALPGTPARREFMNLPIEVRHEIERTARMLRSLDDEMFDLLAVAA